MKIQCYGISNVGMKRSQNEDSYLINDEIGLYMVADGMGGHLGGEFASKLAVTTVEELLSGFLDPEVTQIHGVNTEGSDVGDRLLHAIQEAGRRIHHESLYDEKLRGMGTTAVAVLFDNGKFYVAHVGDSRAYLLRESALQQLTEDHSLVTEQVKAGMISAKDAKSHKLKNVITRSVGYQEEVEADLKVLEAQDGDRIMMCSDGLSNLVEHHEIQEIMKDLELQEACEKLVKTANARGGDDNITVVMLEAG
ncbi:MAG: Stp1/IreP family PP2C-type Ser/Thr phosphatase [Deltaproteobacteria bacterium]|nr:Stp1/IreP family PP2C-type Ser/Thr phosphatase [Deltaproteobacteria bacterium]